jgi:hypothetical protein
MVLFVLSHTGAQLRLFAGRACLCLAVHLLPPTVASKEVNGRWRGALKRDYNREGDHTWHLLGTKGGSSGRCFSISSLSLFTAASITWERE